MPRNAAASRPFPLYMPVKNFLISYRALSDGRVGIRQLEELIKSKRLPWPKWEIPWVGTCTLLRTSIDLFQVDQNRCRNDKIGQAIRVEWELVDKNREDHKIFWDFLREERNNIIHYYEWAASHVWLNEDGTKRPAPGLLESLPEGVRSFLVMSRGPYEGHNSMDLLKESADWVEARIFSAIGRAGFDPDEDRNLLNFQKRPPVEKSLLSR